MAITSNTIVKNGMPYIGLALKRALPYVDQMIITISRKADIETMDEVFNLNFDPKVEIYWEDVVNKGELTEVENDQIRKSKGDWIWTLEDDELWGDDLEKCLSYMSEDIDGISVSPFHVIDAEHYDKNAEHMSLTKFFRREGAFWARPFPRNMIFNKKGMLYHKVNPRVKVVPEKFFHMVLLKEKSFRNEPEWVKYKYKTILPEVLPEKYKRSLGDIIKQVKTQNE